MSDDLFRVLTRFHQEVVLPDIKRVVETKLDQQLRGFRDEVLSSLDAVFQKLDRLDSEYQSLRAAVDRLEMEARTISGKIEKMALRSEVAGLKEKMATLEARLNAIEADL